MRPYRPHPASGGGPAAGPAAIDPAPGEFIRGINEPLPAGEHVLWQGAPDWRALARGPFHVRKVALYFGVLLAWKVAASLGDAIGWPEALAGAAWLLLLAGTGVALLLALAWLASRTTIYAITNRRVMMRIGIALPIFVNLPLKGITQAGLKAGPGGTGDIAMELGGSARLAYLHLWPHARPWRLKFPQPALRSIPQAAAVAQTLARALATEHGVRSPFAAGPVVAGEVQARGNAQSASHAVAA